MKLYHDNKSYNYDWNSNCNDKWGYPSQSSQQFYQPLSINKKFYPSYSSSSSNIFKTQVNSKYKDNNVKEIQYEPIISNSIYNFNNTDFKNFKGNYPSIEMKKENQINNGISNNLIKPKHHSLKPRSAMSNSSKWRENSMGYLRVSREDKAEKEKAHKENKLQRDLSGYQREFIIRVKEISLIRNKAKISKMSKMKNNLHKKTNEFIKLQKALDELQDDLADNEQTIAHYQNRLEFHKDIAIQASEQLKITSKLVSESEEKRDSFEKCNAKLERMIRVKELQSKQLKNQLKDLNNQIEKVTKENEYLEGIYYEKEVSELKNEEDMQTIKNITEQNEELNKEIAKAEKIQSEYIDKLTKYEKEKPRLIEKTKEPPIAYKEKEKKINELLNEINKCIEEHKNKNEKLEVKLSLLNNELEQNKKINKEYKQTIEDLDSNLEINNQRIEELKQQKKKREEDLSRIKNSNNHVVILEMNEINLHEEPHKDNNEEEEEEEYSFDDNEPNLNSNNN